MISPPNPSQSPLPQILLWCLRLVVFLQCVGVAGRYWFSEFEIDSDIYGFLYFDYAWPEAVAQRIDDVGALGCLFAGLVILVPNSGGGRFWTRHFQQFAAAFVAVWMFAFAATHLIRGGLFAELSFGEHAVRYAAPLALMIFLGAKETVSSSRFRIGIYILMIATSATFVVHGYKAIQLHGPFADLILLSDKNWTSFGIGQSMVEKILMGIGVIDLVAAALLWIPRMHFAALYMVIWGTVTAASRMTAMGVTAWPDTLIRSANWGCPLVLALSIILTKTKPSATLQK